MENTAEHLHRDPVNYDDPEQVKALEREKLQDDPIAAIRAGYLSIKNKDGDMVTFTPNSSQTIFFDKIQERRRQKRPVRIFVLKARQVGVSTAAEAVVFSFTSQRSNLNALVLADDMDGASYIFKMNEVFYDQMKDKHPHLTPDIKRGDERRIEFHKRFSQILIETAQNKRAGRKYTLQIVHGSEVAFWPHFTKIMQGLRPAIPEKPETIVILETTANGMNDVAKFWFHIKELYQKDRVATDWIPLFLSWKEHHEYTRPFVNAGIRKVFQDSMSKEEAEIMKTHGLTLEQMNWRRHMIEDGFGGDKETFEVEYPLTDKEAFKSTAKRVFPDRSIMAQRANLISPKFTGEIELVDRRPMLVPDTHGFLKMYQEPQPDERYVIGADSCESALTHDEACAVVIKRSTWATVAHLHGHMNPEDFAMRLEALGYFYNRALLAPERNGPGLVTVTKLAATNYPNMCKTNRSRVTDSGAWEETEEFGFHTNVKTKPMIIDGLRDAYNRAMIVVHDPKILDESDVYVVKDVNKEGYVEYGAEEGFRDDCVMALAIAVYYAHQLPAQRMQSIPERRFSPSTRTGY